MSAKLACLKRLMGQRYMYYQFINKSNIEFLFSFNKLTTPFSYYSIITLCVITFCANIILLAKCYNTEGNKPESYDYEMCMGSFLDILFGFKTLHSIHNVKKIDKSELCIVSLFHFRLLQCGMRYRKYMKLFLYISF